MKKKLKHLLLVFIILVSLFMLGGCQKILEYKVSIYSYDLEDLKTLSISPSGFVLSSCQYMDKVDANEVEKYVQEELDRVNKIDMSTKEGKEVINAYCEGLKETEKIVKNRADKLDFSFIGYVKGLSKKDSETIKKVDEEYSNKLDDFDNKYNEVLEEYSESLEGK